MSIIGRALSTITLIDFSWAYSAVDYRLLNSIIRLTRPVLLVDQELLSLPENLSSPPVFSGVRVTRSLDLYVCFVDRCLSFCTFFLAIVLSVLLRYTSSDCSFGIFKLFFWRFAYLFKHFIQSYNSKFRLIARHLYTASQ